MNSDEFSLQDLLFNAPKLAESLSHLGLRRDAAQEVALATRTRWWRQAIEPYRRESLYDVATFCQIAVENVISISLSLSLYLSLSFSL